MRPERQRKRKDPMTVTINSRLVCGDSVVATETDTIVMGGATEGKTWVPDRDYSALLSVVQPGAEEPAGVPPDRS
jgi:hypothetical protein